MELKGKDFIKRNKLAVLSMIDKEGKPYAAPIFYLFNEKENEFEFLCAVNTHKFEVVMDGADVFLTIVDEDTQEQVSVVGKASLAEVSLQGYINDMSEKINRDDDKPLKADLPLFAIKGDKRIIKIVSKSMRYTHYINGKILRCSWGEEV